MGYGGALFKCGSKLNSPIIKNCFFEENIAFSGSALYIEDLLIIINTKFYENYSTDKRDTIFNLGNLNIENCDFIAESNSIIVNSGQLNQK